MEVLESIFQFIICIFLFSEIGLGWPEAMEVFKMYTNCVVLVLMVIKCWFVVKQD